MDSPAELEIGLHRTAPDVVRIELRFDDPRSEAEAPPAHGIAAFDLEALRAAELDPEGYGEALATQLFADDAIRALYARAIAVAESGGSGLRLRLRLAQSAADLQALRWELLRDPESGAALGTSERVLFSRYMLSADWRPVKLRPQKRLRALVAVAAPHDLERFRLAEIDVEGEVERALRSLGAGPPADATSGTGAADVEVLGRDAPLTLESLVDGLRRGVDILYLVCHGMLSRRGEPFLFLQNTSGSVERASGNQLAERVAELAEPPRLAVLASCESAGAEGVAGPDGRPSAESSIAPRLAEAGVPAVLAMQGKISMETVEAALPVFFRELLVDGVIDRAMAVARGTVRERPDAWMPALYLRLKRGRIWYVPGFAGEEDQFAKWRAIASGVRLGSFIPILGADVAEHVYGPAQELATELGQRHDYPLAAHDRHDLPKVAQYLSIDQSRQYARDQVLRELHARFVERHPELVNGRAETSLPKLLDAQVAAQAEDDPFRILAELGASIYVNSGVDPLLLKTLKAVGRQPRPLLCEWRPSEDNHPRQPACDDEPSAEQPLVYHVFGVLGKPGSLVLTEDDFFDYLIATAEYRLIPTVVRGSLTRSSLLFLGFRLDDWTFRVLYRMIMTLGGTRQLRDFAHVGVQVNPEEHSLIDVERARRYLEAYYGGGGDAPPISIYWGSARDFLTELRSQVEALGEEATALPMEEDEDDWLT